MVDSVLDEAVLVVPGFQGGVAVRPMSFTFDRDTVARGQIGAVIISTPAVATEDGVRVGQTLGQLRARVGSVLIFNDWDDGVHAIPRGRRGITYQLRGPQWDSVPGGWAGDTLAQSDIVPNETGIVPVFVFRVGH